MEEEKEKKAAQGIGTLIIFIALILVAAVAAGVLIQTAASLQSKSLDVGRQSQERVVTDVEVVQVYTQDTSDGIINGGVDNFSMTLRLSSGSQPIKFEDTLIKLDATDAGRAMNYVWNSTNNSATTFTYSVRYLINGTQHLDGYMAPGDSAELTFFPDANVNITEGSRVVIRVIPKNGAIKPVDMHIPTATVEAVTYLFP